MKFKVNKDLLLMKGFYFFFNGACGPVAPYLTVIAKSIGYSTTNVGLVLTAIPLLSLATKPIIGSLADKFSIHKALFLTLMVVCTGSMFSLKWFTDAPIDSSVLLRCEAGSRIIAIEQGVKLDDASYMDKAIAVTANNSLKCELNCDKRQQLDSDSLMETFEVELIFSKLQFQSVYQHQSIILNVTSIVDLNGEQRASSCSSADFSCDLFCSDPEIQKLIDRPAAVNDAPSRAQFWMFALFTITWRTGTNTAYTFADTITLQLLKDKPEDFGKQRVFGSAGWGLIGLIGGFMTDWYSQGKQSSDYTLGFYLGLILNLSCVVIVFNVKYEKEKKPTTSILSDVRKAILGNRQFILFLFVVIFCGIYSSLVWSYLLWYVEDIYPGDKYEGPQLIKTLSGLIIFVHTYIGEIGFFSISGKMVTRFGPANCISLVVFTFFLRFTIYYFISNPWWLLPVEVLNGINYATFITTSATYANEIAPPGARTTVQGFTSGVFDIGLCTGIFFGGLLIDNWGGRLTFLMAGISAFALGILYNGLRFCVQDSSSPQKPNPDSCSK